MSLSNDHSETTRNAACAKWTRRCVASSSPCSGVLDDPSAFPRLLQTTGFFCHAPRCPAPAGHPNRAASSPVTSWQGGTRDERGAGSVGFSIAHLEEPRALFFSHLSPRTGRSTVVHGRLSHDSSWVSSHSLSFPSAASVAHLEGSALQREVSGTASSAVKHNVLDPNGTSEGVAGKTWPKGVA